MNAARIVFRVDSGLAMGAGHVMRCLSLADALREGGAECVFVCRDNAGAAHSWITQRGHRLELLPAVASADESWLGVDWHTDAEQTRAALPATAADWLVVDHYGIDRRWEAALADRTGRLMVIDDLANRDHACDLLLDQTLGRRAEDYAARVPPDCRVLAGADFALLRPDFAALRAASLERRHEPCLRHVLVSMGGTDLPNLSAQVLDAIESAHAPGIERVTLVLGGQSPWREDIESRVARMRVPVELRVDVPKMAELMLDADLAIGSSGTSAWERCCLGLPAIMFVAAENQRGVAAALEACGAALVLEAEEVGFIALPGLLRRLGGGMDELARMSAAAAAVTDGLGATRAREVMFA